MSEKRTENPLREISRPFPLLAEILKATIRKCQNRSIEAAQVIAELIELAKQMREGNKRGEKLGLTDDEVAFYDALQRTLKSKQGRLHVNGQSQNEPEFAAR